MEEISIFNQEKHNSKSQDHINYLKLKMRCLCSNEDGYLLCSQTNCKAYSILCQNIKCQCQTVNHKDCMKFIKICKLLPPLYQRNQSPVKKQIITKIEEIYNEAIDMLSEARDNLIKDIQYYEFSQSQRQLIQKLDEFKFQQINGQIISKACLNITIPKVKQLKKEINEKYYQPPKQLVYNRIKVCIQDMKKILGTLNKDYLDSQDRSKKQKLQLQQLINTFTLQKQNLNQIRFQDQWSIPQNFYFQPGIKPDMYQFQDFKLK